MRSITLLPSHIPHIQDFNIPDTWAVGGEDSEVRRGALCVLVLDAFGLRGGEGVQRLQLSGLYNLVHRGSSERLFGGEEKVAGSWLDEEGGKEKKRKEGKLEEREEEKKVEAGVGNSREEKDDSKQTILEGEDNSDDDDNDKARRSSFLGESQESRGSRGSYVFGYGSEQTQHMVVFSGLRGAVALCCASNFPDKHEGLRDQIVLITMFVVLISVFLLGSTTDPMLRFLKIETNVDETKYEILISELKVKFMATFDVLLSRFCLDQAMWDFDYYCRDSTQGWHESLISFVSGGNNSSLISRPEALEHRVSAVGSSVGSNLDGLGVTPEEREKAIMGYKPEERKVEGGGGETKEILDTLVVDIDPDRKVKNSMNEINATKRLRQAAIYKAEADKVRQVKAAEADAEARYLSGKGVARQERGWRRWMIGGWKREKV
ncbi:hypothetical protein TrCOL_g4400 [Triparma columacea]|uniref:Cation/H+ exchanger domain-containing protein n=1 Tax=Triparma columacea TaxID=722753 RepID=A0A9W7GG91_9STRA|nr:hypothetical protein TrCOL_g4400 [Triparma columacea]